MVDLCTASSHDGEQAKYGACQIRSYFTRVLTIVYPLSSQDEMVMFIYSEGGGVYSRQLLSRCLAELNVIYEKVSVEAYAAFTTMNLCCEECFGR